MSVEISGEFVGERLSSVSSAKTKFWRSQTQNSEMGTIIGTTADKERTLAYGNRE
jgi:hypothetical protein